MIFSKFKVTLLTWVKALLGLEILIEDIPQLVLTVQVLNAKNGGQWSAVAAFNATTSGFNFIFNLLDMFMPLDEEHYADGKKNDKKNAKKYADDSTLSSHFEDRNLDKFNFSTRSYDYSIASDHESVTTNKIRMDYANARNVLRRERHNTNGSSTLNERILTNDHEGRFHANDHNRFQFNSSSSSSV